MSKKKKRAKMKDLAQLLVGLGTTLTGIAKITELVIKALK